MENCYIAGVIAAGNDNNSIFIENGKYHGGIIAQSILRKTNSTRKLNFIYFIKRETMSASSLFLSF